LQRSPPGFAGLRLACGETAPSGRPPHPSRRTHRNPNLPTLTNTEPRFGIIPILVVYALFGWPLQGGIAHTPFTFSDLLAPNAINYSHPTVNDRVVPKVQNRPGSPTNLTANYLKNKSHRWYPPLPSSSQVEALLPLSFAGLYLIPRRKGTIIMKVRALQHNSQCWTTRPSSQTTSPRKEGLFSEPPAPEKCFFVT